ncbi:peptidoglycan bridge formation glycyltransferase FemA/FemB family protein [Candidatus Daviesbacteria bacterium]|nr:peptidoglycan bridge formation glycyltransferase FemA/FemB family protein [Candidatus Daviesbacteria bacterium]
MLKITEVKNQQIWDSFIARSPLYTFFQSWNWGEFNKNMGDEIFRLGIFDGEKLAGVALVVKVFAKRGTFLFCPHGPIFQKDEASYWQFFLKFLKKMGQDLGVDFVRISPVLPNSPKYLLMFKKQMFINAPIHMSAESSWILDLEGRSEEELLAEMRKTTRYEIRQAIKSGWQVEKSTDPKDMKIFLKLYHQTVERENFVPFSDKYLEEEFKTFVKTNQAMLFLEKHQTRYVAALMVIFYGKGAFYHQGATLHRSGESASYLAEWEAIKEARSRRCNFYNFWGIAPTNSPKHPWYGLSLFKKGFGGKQIDFVHAQDYPFKKWKYLPIYILERWRKLKRGL